MKKLIVFAMLLTNVSHAQIVNEGPGHFVDTANYVWEFDRYSNPLTFRKAVDRFETGSPYPNTIQDIKTIENFIVPFKANDELFAYFKRLLKLRYQDLGNDESYFDAEDGLHINLIKHADCIWVQVMDR